MKASPLTICRCLGYLLLYFVVATRPSDGLVVTNTNDSGAGSLRQAILDANDTTLHPGLDTITFNILGAGVHTIAPATQLPVITNPVVIDGYTQPGANANTLAAGDNAVILIELRGPANGGGAPGLRLSTGSDGSTIRGLVINGFNSATTSAILVTGSGSHTIEGCFLGTDTSGLGHIELTGWARGNLSFPGKV